MRPRISIRGSVRPSVRRSVRRSVTRFFKWADNGWKWSEMTRKTVCKWSKLVKKSSELSQNVPRCPKIPKWPLQTHRCPNGLVYTTNINHESVNESTFVRTRSVFENIKNWIRGFIWPDQRSHPLDRVRLCYYWVQFWDSKFEMWTWISASAILK